jgi:hypothetical protein
MAAILHYYLCDLGCGGSAVNFAMEAFLRKLRYQAAMVQVGMGQQNGIYRVRGNRKFVPVPVPQVPFLVKPAVNKDIETVYLQKVARTGNVFRCS